jgi:hypothetical protein
VPAEAEGATSLILLVLLVPSHATIFAPG